MKLIRDSSASYGPLTIAGLNVVAASAERLINPYDIVFSCLPLLSLPLRISMRILNQIRQQMSADGLFIQFRTARCLKRCFPAISAGSALW